MDVSAEISAAAAASAGEMMISGGGGAGNLTPRKGLSGVYCGGSGEVNGAVVAFAVVEAYAAGFWEDDGLGLELLVLLTAAQGLPSTVVVVVLGPSSGCHCELWRAAAHCECHPLTWVELVAAAF